MSDRKWEIRITAEPTRIGRLIQTLIFSNPGTQFVISREGKQLSIVAKRDEGDD